MNYLRSILAAVFILGSTGLNADFSPGGPGAPANAPNGLTGSIDLPNIGATNPATLDHYESGSFVAICSNCTSNPTFTYTRIGNNVCVTLPASGVVTVGTGSLVFVSGVPASIRPTQFRQQIFGISVNGAGKIAYMGFYVNDRIDIYEEFVTFDISFPASATVLFGSSFANEPTTVCYNR